MTNDNYTDHDEHFVMHTVVKALCCTPETNMILYVNYTSIRNKNLKIMYKLKSRSEVGNISELVE